MVFVIGMVGLPAAGKSTFAQKVVEKFGFSHINKDKLRFFFRDNITYFHGADHSHHNDLIDSVNRVVKISSDELVRELVGQGQNIIIDSYGGSKERRDNRKEPLKGYDTKLIIVYVTEDEKVILDRLGKRDNGNNWVEYYHKKWKPSFEVPEEKECDHLIKVNKDNHQESLEKIKKIIEG
jgi:adenylate kinase family enzyme